MPDFWGRLTATFVSFSAVPVELSPNEFLDGSAYRPLNPVPLPIGCRFESYAMHHYTMIKNDLYKEELQSLAQTVYPKDAV